MKFYRYMSIEEFVKMSVGQNLKSNYNQQFTNNNTDSQGFCFIADKTIGKSTKDDDMESLVFRSSRTMKDNKKQYEFSPEECLEFLSMVTKEILVEFEEINSPDWHIGYGIYKNPNDVGDMEITEYSLPEYNKNILKPLRYIIVPNETNIQDNVWEEFLDEKNYTIKEMKDLFIKRKFSPSADSNFLTLSDNLKFLPAMPNSNGDNIWRILKNKEKGINSLVYGNPITEEEIYELRFDSEKKVIDFGEKIPEFWRPLKTLYDNNPDLSKDYIELFNIAAFIATYPQMQEEFELMIRNDTLFNKEWGPDIYLKNDDIELSIDDLWFSPKEDDTLDITYIDDDDKKKSIFDNSIQKNEHTAPEIGTYVSDVRLEEFTQGLNEITNGNIQKELDNPSKE